MIARRRAAPVVLAATAALPSLAAGTTRRSGLAVMACVLADMPEPLPRPDPAQTAPR